jgi:hypothetical protein
MGFTAFGDPPVRVGYKFLDISDDSSLNTRRKKG